MTLRHRVAEGVWAASRALNRLAEWIWRHA
jgi:hypothetical protein